MRRGHGRRALALITPRTRFTAKRFVSSDNARLIPHAGPPDTLVIPAADGGARGQVLEPRFSLCEGH